MEESANTQMPTAWKNFISVANDYLGSIYATPVITQGKVTTTSLLIPNTDQAYLRNIRPLASNSSVAFPKRLYIFPRIVMCTQYQN
jgi:hypothetical protein